MSHARRSNFNKISSRIIRHLMDKHGMTMTAIAQVVGVDKSFISRCASAERELSSRQMAALADHFDMGLGAFLLSTRPPREPRSEQEREIFGLIRNMMNAADRAQAALKTHQADPAA